MVIKHVYRKSQYRPDSSHPQASYNSLYLKQFRATENDVGRVTLAYEQLDSQKIESHIRQ